MGNQVIPAERRIDGMYGEVWVDRQWWADVEAISGTITVERKPINPAGTAQTYNKRGRVSREGSFTFAQVDSSRTKQFIANANRTLADRRANRATPWFPKFNLLIRLDDPDAWGVEEIQLMNCEMWTMPVGFSLSELVMREVQITWEYEDTNAALSSITQP